MFRLKAILFSMLLGMVISQGVAQSSSGRTDQSNVKIDIYPNPATHYLTVDLSKTNTSSVTFELRSMIGNTIKVSPEKVGYQKYRIPLKDYATGYYFLIIQDEQRRFKKAIKFLKH